MTKGIFTSEFWVTLLTGAITAICQALKLDPKIQEAILKLALAYIGSRTVIKVANNIKKNGS